jgi:hypothetical protein
VIVFEDLALATYEVGGEIVSISDDAVVLRIVDLLDFGMNLAQRNTEWDEEATYFMESRTPIDSQTWAFTYPVSYPEGRDDYTDALVLARDYAGVA